MKVSSDPKSLNEGDVLYAKKQFFRVMNTHAQACMRCCLRSASCQEYIGGFCPSSRYYETIRPTPKIKHALDIALLQGEVFAEELQ